ncbi:MAG: DUF1549 domain-containing protein [Bryobacteraceae bacterium]
MRPALPFLFAAIFFGGGLCGGILSGATGGSGEDCSFRADPGSFLQRQAREQMLLFAQTSKVGSRSAGKVRTVAPADIPRRNFIDGEIFDKLAEAGVPSAPVATDEVFLRRIYLDLTGRIPSPADVREFLADPSTDKRSRVIDRLLYSREFVDRWTMWMGDLVGNVIVNTNINRQFRGRNAFYNWIYNSISQEKSLRDMVFEMISASGNSYDPENGAVNYLLGSRQTMGPAQDVYDFMLFQVMERFAGMGHYDCLLCHDGRRHLDQLSLWGGQATRGEAQRLSAFFSRITLQRVTPQADPLYNSFNVGDRAAGGYNLNTISGNRPARQPVGSLRVVMPEYRDGTPAGSDDWRSEFAAKLVDDPIVAINFANRLWKAMFGYGLVEPVDALDPARLDPDNPPPAPWTLQASHPRLLILLANELRSGNFKMREFLRLIAESSAYQLSANYDGEWNVSHVPLFARRYPRRLEGEEVHDAITKATGIFTPYRVNGFDAMFEWACQLPDPQEPRTNGASRLFMDAFLRGNRDTVTRSREGSIIQQLSLMNNAFVTNRLKVRASENLRNAAAIADNGAAVEELFLLILGHAPPERERAEAIAHLEKARTAAARNLAIEDLAWVLVNKTEFLFSY